MFFMYSEENFERTNGAKEILFKVPWKHFKWSLSGMPETKESEFNQKLTVDLGEPLLCILRFSVCDSESSQVPTLCLGVFLLH